MQKADAVTLPGVAVREKGVSSARKAVAVTTAGVAASLTGDAMASKSVAASRADIAAAEKGDGGRPRMSWNVRWCRRGAKEQRCGDCSGSSSLLCRSAALPLRPSAVNLSVPAASPRQGARVLNSPDLFPLPALLRKAMHAGGTVQAGPLKWRVGSAILA